LNSMSRILISLKNTEKAHVLAALRYCQTNRIDLSLQPPYVNDEGCAQQTLLTETEVGKLHERISDAKPLTIDPPKSSPPKRI
jgi:hypothetical protein